MNIEVNLLAFIVFLIAVLVVVVRALSTPPKLLAPTCSGEAFLAAIRAETQRLREIAQANQCAVHRAAQAVPAPKPRKPAPDKRRRG